MPSIGRRTSRSVAGTAERSGTGAVQAVRGPADDRSDRVVALSARGLEAEYEIPNSDDVFRAVSGLDLEVYEGEFLTVVGPSGCGKTTFLNIVDGLLPWSGGTIELNGKPIGRPDRSRTMVFQQASLFPWLTVADNVIYGLKLGRKHTKAQMREIGQHYIDLVGLSGFEKSYPSQLSGGMQQRVNLARALALDPAMILLDEPFAALDAQTREYMQLELLKIWIQTKKTAIFITHDIKEAVFLADRVAVFTRRPGRVKLVVDIDLPRPRVPQVKREARFLQYEADLWSAIEEEGRVDAAS